MSPFKQDSRGFHVPEEEADSASDQSREASLQIIDSHPRPYSVPSSDDDSDSDDDGEIIEGSAVTTPEHVAEKQQGSSDLGSDSSDDDESIDYSRQCAKVSDPTIQKEETLGTSQSNPIDLEGPSKHVANFLEIDSDDEGPEILPISQSYLQAVGNVSATGSFADPTPNYRTTIDSSMSTKNYDELPPLANGVANNDVKGQDMTGTGISYPRLRSPKYISQGSIEDTTDDFDSNDEDDYENDDDFLMERHNYPEQMLTNGAFQRSGLLSFAAPKLRATFNVTSDENIAPPPGVSYCGDANGSQEIAQSCLAPSQRPPSPSDAALAKKADTSDSRPKWSSSNDQSNVSTVPAVENTRKQQDTPQPKLFQERLNNSMSAEPAWQYTFDDPESELIGYEDGPFASKSKVNLSPLCLPHLSQQPWRPCTVPSPVQPQGHSVGGSQSFKMPAVGGSKLRSSTTMPEITNDLSDGLPGDCGDLKALHKINQVQSSKVNISDLVNSYADIARNLKRKADDISTDSEIQEAVSTQSQASLLDDTKIQDVRLADAQARDVPDLEVSFSQESFVTSIPDVGLPSAITQTSDFDQPTRKKMRTSGPSIGGFGKFASGICVGVAGALAAFLATIPLSVREEALREFQNAA